MAEQKSEDDMKRWFETELLPQLVSENRFPMIGSEPSNLSILTLKWETTADRNSDHFASTPFFLRLTLCCNAQEKEITKEFPLMVKFIPQSIALRTHMGIDLQFYNEMAMYEQVLPAFKKFLQNQNTPSTYFNELCPHCYYANIDLNNADYGIIILDDLRQIGYKPAVSKVELDYKHCELALKQLAKFHAVSYAMKLDNSKEFETLKNSFKECKFMDKPNQSKEETMEILFELSGLRGVDCLLAQSNCVVPKEYLQYLRTFFTSGVNKNLQNLLIPDEPLSVLAHGDFCRNNILFRLNGEEPNGCVLFDFATFRYSSPTVDLSFFFYLNTTQPFREKYFEKLFNAYHSTIIENVATILSRTKAQVSEIYPLHLFYKDFSDHAVYGYSLIAFFLPRMMCTEENPGLFLEDFLKLSSKQRAEKNVKIGGEQVTKKIADVIIDMYKRKSQAEQMNTN